MTNHLFDGHLLPDPDPSRPVLIAKDGSVATTYGQARDRTGQYAQALASLGVKPGDRVLVQVEKSAEALLLYLAVIRNGAIFLPLNTAYTVSELEYFIQDAEPKVIVCSPLRLDSIREVARVPGVAIETMDADGSGSLRSRADGMSMDWTEAPRGPNDLAAILYTSGTTGRSKGAMLSHENILSNAKTLVGSWRFSAKDILIHALPIFHAHGLFVAANVSMTVGCRMIFLPKFDAAEVLALFGQATVMMGVPTFYTRLLDQPGLDKAACSGMRLFVSGSAPLLADTHQAFEARTGHAILERYGMTETCMNTSNPYEGDRLPGSVGPALPGIVVRVRDAETGGELAEGDLGMLQVKGPNVFGGYWKMPENTKSEFTEDGFFITGDLGKIDERDYVWILGRGKDLVISGGYNIYPKEVELEIDALPGVSESAVIGIPHKDFGEAVTAVVVPEKGASLSERDIIDALRSKLANFKLPKRVHFVDELPRNAMAKVQKNVLRERFGTDA